MVEFTARENISGFLNNNPGVMTASTLILVAFCIFAANAILFQPIDHPKPIWGNNNRNVSSIIQPKLKTPIPYRRIETVKILPQHVAIPSLHPGKKIAVNSIQKLIGEMSDKFPNKQAKELALVQKSLKQIGIYAGEVDGLDGPKTRAAVSKFQKTRDMEETGNITVTLVNRLSIAVQSARQLATNSASPTTALTGKINSGSAKLITRVQIGLINFGERNIKIDGVMGNKTADAIRRFQHRFKLDVTGKPSETLVKKLVSVGALTRG